MPKTITIPLELADMIVEGLDLAIGEGFPTNALRELESCIEAGKIQLYANRPIPDSLIVPPVTDKTPDLRDIDPRDIAVGLFDHEYEGKYLSNENKGDNHG
jgi:hypothetical protein